VASTQSHVPKEGGALRKLNFPVLLFLWGAALSFSTVGCGTFYEPLAYTVVAEAVVLTAAYAPKEGRTQVYFSRHPSVVSSLIEECQQLKYTCDHFLVDYVEVVPTGEGRSSILDCDRLLRKPQCVVVQVVPEPERGKRK
jgi:hypothetical protein